MGPVGEQNTKKLLGPQELSKLDFDAPRRVLSPRPHNAYHPMRSVWENLTHFAAELAMRAVLSRDFAAPQKEIHPLFCSVIRPQSKENGHSWSARLTYSCL
jgi:hypothetical protein